jgi:hypothetical protein
VRRIEKKPDRRKATLAAINKYGILTTSQVLELAFPENVETSSSARRTLESLRNDYTILSTNAELGTPALAWYNRESVEIWELPKVLFVNDIGVLFERAARQQEIKMDWARNINHSDYATADALVKLEIVTEAGFTTQNIWIVFLDEDVDTLQETNRVRAFAKYLQETGWESAYDTPPILLYVCEPFCRNFEELQLLLTSSKILAIQQPNTKLRILATTTELLASDDGPLGEVYIDPSRGVIERSPLINPGRQTTT